MPAFFGRLKNRGDLLGILAAGVLQFTLQLPQCGSKVGNLSGSLGRR